MTNGTRNRSDLSRSEMNTAIAFPKRKPEGIPAAIRTASSPSRIYAISPRVNPSTLRLASSLPRSESAIRALLYTTPNAMLAARAVMTKVKTRNVPPMVS